MTIVYKGWIPTVAGKLSFSLIGEANGNNPVAVSVNRADSRHRYVVSYQHRFLVDSVLPIWLSGIVNKYCGSFNFVCIGKSSNDISVQNDKLSGYLLIFDDKKNWSWAEREIRHCQDKLASLDVSVNDLAAGFDSHFNFIKEDLKPKASFWVNFTLARNGVVEIVLDEGYDLGADKPLYPPTLADKKRIEDTQSAQTFYFLRDLVHKHQHHSPTTDTLLDLYRSGDDNQWIGESLRVLYRKILDFKRLRKDEVYCSSLGLLSYAKSLRQIAKDDYGGCSICPKINDELLKESIMAGQTATNNSVQESIRRSDITRNTIISVLGLFLAFTSLMKLTDQTISVEKDSLLYVVAEWTVRNSLYSLVLVGLFVYLGLVFRGVVPVGRFATVRGMYRLMQSFPKGWNAVIWLLVGVVSIVVVGYLII